MTKEQTKGKRMRRGLLVTIPTHQSGSQRYPYPPTPAIFRGQRRSRHRRYAEPGRKGSAFLTNQKDLELHRGARERQAAPSGGGGGRTCPGADGAGAAEALLLDDEADPDEGGGGDGEERALEVGGEEVAAGVRRGGAHRAAARGRRRI